MNNASHRYPSSSVPDATAIRPKLSRHPEFWFSDGSVVLLAHDVLFRVHKTFLARHSVVFRDMFSMPQPSAPIPTAASTLASSSASPSAAANANSSNNSETASSILPEDLLTDLTLDDGEAVLDGRPVVCLHDSPDDVASLLYALYDGPKFGNNSRADFRVVSGILRLASKYVIDVLRTRALAHLSIAWPATLKGWDAREEAPGNGDGCSEEQRHYPNPVEVINLAREVNAPSLLPSAFYDLSRYSLVEVFEHSQRATEVATQNLSAYRHAELSLADTQRLAMGKESAHCAVTALIRSLATEARSNPSHTYVHSNGGHHARGFAARHQHRRSDSASGAGGRCGAPAACWRDVCELVDLATQHYLFDRERGAADPLYVAEELALLKGSGDSQSGSGRADGIGVSGVHGVGLGLLDEDLGDSGTCRACARAFEVWASKERERLWRAIPGWFKLEQ